MSVYELFAAIALGASAICSAALYISRHSNTEGKVYLPTTASSADPFDVGKPQDFVDGTPVEEETFWHRLQVALRRTALGILLAIILSLYAIGLGWSIIDYDPVILISYIVQIPFAAYLFSLLSGSLQKQVSTHAAAITHLSALTFSASFLLGISALLPSNTPHTGGILLVIRVVVLVLFLCSFSIAVTTPRGPSLHYSSERVYSQDILLAVTSKYEDNVSGFTGASVWDILFFSYTNKVINLAHSSSSLEIGDLPIVPADMRAPVIYSTMKAAIQKWRPHFRSWKPQPGSGWNLIYQLYRLNAKVIGLIALLSTLCATMYYAPHFFLKQVVQYLEHDPERKDRSWGWVYCIVLFVGNLGAQLVARQMWSLSNTTLQVRLRVQLNTILFAKTLVRKDIASSGSSEGSKPIPSDDTLPREEEEDSEFSSKAQVMTLMTTDADRISEFAWHLYSIIAAVVETTVGTLLLYYFLGVSCLYGSALSLLFLPLNHFSGKIVITAQEGLMKSRDERVSLMNEILGAIRMLKFMAWERNFEARVHRIRTRELKYQWMSYVIETLWWAVYHGSPLLVTLFTFWHFTVYRGQTLTPSTAFAAIAVFDEMKFALVSLPETIINMIQSLVSARRIETYLDGVEVAPLPSIKNHNTNTGAVVLQSATITWPCARSNYPHSSESSSSTPCLRSKFILSDISLKFPPGELSLICGKLGSGKSLLLLAVLGEADILSGQVICPRTPPDAIASFTESISNHAVSEADWVVPGICAYVPQTSWLRNASIRDNILFDLPYVEQRYRETLKVCALEIDLKVLEDGDLSEIGERGVNLSGGQKARVSLARAVYSRASILLLDDVLSAVDAHTARHLFYECLKGDLLRGRTIILVSHHVQLCIPGAQYIVALDNGRVQFEGNRQSFQNSEVLEALIHSNAADASDDKEQTKVHTVEEIEIKGDERPNGDQDDNNNQESNVKAEKKAPRKLVEEEARVVGNISKDVWFMYFKAYGGVLYWLVCITFAVLTALIPLFQNGWLKIWTGNNLQESSEPHSRSASFYIGVYTAISVAGLVFTTFRLFIIYHGGLHASSIIHTNLLQSVLFANIRFHDTSSRGRILNRFGKDLERIDSALPDDFSRTAFLVLSCTVSFVTISLVGGLPFAIVLGITAYVYYRVGRLYGQISRDMRRLDSVTRSPLYSLYGETIAGVAVIRAFGASTKFLRNMLRRVDTNTNPYYWMWGVNRWLSARFDLIASLMLGFVGCISVLIPGISPSTAGLTLAFATTVSPQLLFLVRQFVGLQQSMVAVERVKEYTELKSEAPEVVEPRPPASWPSDGVITCENLSIRYAPDLPDVLHNLNFEVKPAEKIGILGRTGSGKSTLALSFFRFVEATEGRIVIDGIDISTLGLSDLRNRLTIIPQDPTILSGTLRSTLDVFGEYEDTEIYEALRRVHLIPTGDASDTGEDINANVFRNLDSAVSEGGENFSAGEKQLLCMARAILKRSRILIMDEATASVDYATDELIGKTIRHEFAGSTILTIAHRLRTVIDYDRIMLLGEGRIIEFDSPAKLLNDKSSSFHALCNAAGSEELQILRNMAGVTSQ
ncbi:ATP-binding cassette transporter C [Abortiporus biennis]